MPVIKEILFGIDVKDDGLIEILKEEINRCGCLDLVVKSNELDTPVSHLLNVMRSINGVVCNDAGMCCATDITGFADKLKKFRGES
jgi:hypothetical protein